MSNKLASHIVRTPLIRHSDSVFLKPENLQPFGSYKIRGIAELLQACDKTRLANGLACASAGNMAQAVAFGAQLYQVPCEIFVPESIPKIKRDAIIALGAKCVYLPFNKVWEKVQNDCSSDYPGIFVHPANNPDLLKGYGTIANEILQDAPDVDALVIPFGVGGLALGISTALHAQKHNVDIYTAEPDTAAPLHASLKAGKPMQVERHPSFVDAIGVPEVLPSVYERIESHITQSLVMPIKTIKITLNQALKQHKLLLEGAAACALAASQQLARTQRYKKIVCILSGGNIDIDDVV